MRASPWMDAPSGALLALHRSHNRNGHSEPLLLGLPLRIFVALKLEERLTRGDEHYTYFWLIPVKDLLNVGIWAFAFFGNEVQWRGERFKVLQGGKLEKQR